MVKVECGNTTIITLDHETHEQVMGILEQFGITQHGTVEN